MKFLKRFYNPFKPHICRLSTGDYSVRKLTLSGMYYLSAVFETDNLKWWAVKSNVLCVCVMHSKEEAESRLRDYNKSQIKVKIQRKGNMTFFKRFYNPFKPHIVQFSNDEYAIRRWSLGWEYLDTDIRGYYAGYWWRSTRSALKYSAFTSLDKAKEHLKNHPKPKVVFARRVE